MLRVTGPLMAVLLLTICIGHVAYAQPALQRPAGAADIREVVAGFQALFTCSAHFLMQRPLEDILEVELVDLQPFNLPPPQIDHTRQLVRATHPDDTQVTAVYRDSMGCTLLPPHWREADAARLPYVGFPAAPDLSEVDFPTGDRADPQPSEALHAVLEQAFDGKTFGEQTVTAGVVIVHRGKLLGERYRPGFGIHRGYRTWSTAKSISATLIGIAQHAGLLSVQEPARIPEWQYLGDPRQAITWEHLLHMSSGLYSEGANTNALYFAGQDVISSATTTHLEASPNSRWKYANNDTLLLLRGLRAVLEDDLSYLRYPYDHLFHRIGMYHTRMETDHLGNFIGSSQVYTTARDLARFGLLYLNDGVWQSERILPTGWTDYVAAAAPALPRETGKRGYGAQFWLLDQLPGVPQGTYTSAGNKGQYSTIVPTHELVIVRTGVDPNGKTWAHDKFINAVIAALD